MARNTPETIGKVKPSQETRLGRMLSAGRITVTMTSKASGRHITLTMQSRLKKGQREWSRADFVEASHVFIKQGHGDYNSMKIGTYYPQKGIIYWDTTDPAYRYAVLKTFQASQDGSQETDAHSIVEMEQCGRCGKALTDPISIARGLGPTCYGNETGSEHYHKQPESSPATPTVDRTASDALASAMEDAQRRSAELKAVEEERPAADAKGRTLPKSFAALAAQVKQ